VRETWFRIFLLLHILGAIAAVGPTLTYGLWAYRADKAPEHRSYILDTISWVDGHMATPAYITQAFTGIALILVAEWDFFDTAWLLTGVILYVLTTVVAIVVYAPTVRRHRAAAAALHPSPGDAALQAAYASAAATSRTQGIVVTIMTLGIVFLMVWKPALWN
jgi:uncharacterized membrane protein